MNWPERHRSHDQSLPLGLIWVRTRYDAQQRTVHVEVEDEGKGIEPEDRDRLFLPYFSNTKNGTGLGLAIVNRIITDHHGHIRVLSNGSNGTTFAMELAVGENGEHTAVATHLEQSPDKHQSVQRRKRGKR